MVIGFRTKAPFGIQCRECLASRLCIGAVIVLLLYTFSIHFRLHRLRSSSLCITAPTRTCPNVVFNASNNSILPPGVIMKSVGGLGNQLFEYACSYSLAVERNWPLFIEVTGTDRENRSFSPYTRDFALDMVNIPSFNFVNTSHLGGNLSIYTEQEFLARDFSSMSDCGREFVQMKGYCQSLLYFENHQDTMLNILQPSEDIKSTLSNSSRKRLKHIHSSNSVAVHVRRGDFLSQRFLNYGHFVPISFQRIAIRRMIAYLAGRSESKPTFFVFSDDIEFARNHFSDLFDNIDIVYVSSSNTTSIQEFYLMTKCKHIIFPNSTFSWWAAYLNKNDKKIVMTTAFNPIHHNSPQFPELHTLFYHPTKWIVIDVFSGEIT